MENNEMEMMGLSPEVTAVKTPEEQEEEAVFEVDLDASEEEVMAAAEKMGPREFFKVLGDKVEGAVKDLGKMKRALVLAGLVFSSGATAAENLSYLPFTHTQVKEAQKIVSMNEGIGTESLVRLLKNEAGLTDAQSRAYLTEKNVISVSSAENAAKLWSQIGDGKSEQVASSDVAME